MTDKHSQAHTNQPEGEPIEGQDTHPTEDAPATPDKKATKNQGSKPGKKAGGAAQLAALEEKLAAAEQKSNELNDKFLRTAAEYENYRRRSQKEQESTFGHGVSHAVVQLLPIVDILEAAANAECSDAEYKRGVLMILTKCNEVFQKLGVAEVEAMGKPFDPALHNAVMQEEAEGAESGAITRVMQKGYSLHGEIIRHAMVAVAP